MPWCWAFQLKPPFWSAASYTPKHTLQGAVDLVVISLVCVCVVVVVCVCVCDALWGKSSETQALRCLLR